MLLVNVLVAILPAVIILLWAYRRDIRKAQEPRLVFRAFLLGFVAAVVAILGGFIIAPAAGLLPPFAALLYRAFIVAAFTEESAKLLVVLLLIRPHQQFDEITDGVVYTIAAALGFAFLENVLYSGGTTGVLVIRAVTAVPLHAIAGGIMGYYVGLSKFDRDADLAWGPAAAILIHGLYNALVFAGSWLIVAAVAVLIGGGIWLRHLFTLAVEADRRAARPAGHGGS